MWTGHLFINAERWLWQGLWPCPVTEQGWFSPPWVSQVPGVGWVRGCSWWLQLWAAQGWGVLCHPSIRLVASESLESPDWSPCCSWTHWVLSEHHLCRDFLSHSPPPSLCSQVASCAEQISPELPWKSENTQVLLGEENSIFAFHLVFCLGFFRALHWIIAVDEDLVWRSPVPYHLCSEFPPSFQVFGSLRARSKSFYFFLYPILQTLSSLSSPVFPHSSTLLTFPCFSWCFAKLEDSSCSFHPTGHAIKVLFYLFFQLLLTHQTSASRACFYCLKNR